MRMGGRGFGGGSETGMFGGGVEAARRGDDFASAAHAAESTTDGVIAVIDLLDNLGDGQDTRTGFQAGEDGLADRGKRGRDRG